jgi:transcriptional regulator with XRE-family HTH domain
MEKLDKKEFGARLRKARDDKRITQDQIAEVCGKSRNAVSNWENGINFPEVEHLHLTCRLLETSSDELLGLKGVESPISGIPPRIIKAAKKLAALPTESKEQIIGIIEGFSPAITKEVAIDTKRLQAVLEALDDFLIAGRKKPLEISADVRVDWINRIYNNQAIKTKVEFTAEIIKLSSRR